MRWIVRNKIDFDSEQKLKSATVPTTLLQLLYNRNLQTKEAITEFLYKNTFDDPFLMPDMHAFTKRIRTAMDNKEKVVIHGDYDVDGVCSSAIMYLYLRDELGFENISVYIPNRHDEGYGLSRNTLEKFIAEHVDLVITVDCGIKDADLVAYANENGIDVIVSDHHTPPEELPKAVAVLHPMFYSYNNLCGAGVAFKMVQALDVEFDLDKAMNYIDLAGLGTVCDVMELIGENRVIVKKALDALRLSKRKGLLALFHLANIQKEVIDVYHIGYIIGPRINASGRLESAYASLELLTTDDATIAATAAEALSDINKRRQEETQEAMEYGLAQVTQDDFINIIYIPHISIGIVGLVAGKLTEQTGKPSIVLTDDSQEGIYAASCRSIEEYNIVEALDGVSELLVSHGGHKKAAGLKVRAELLPSLKEMLGVHAKKQLANKDITKTIYIDMELSLDSLNLAELYTHVIKLEPFGELNARPLFLSRGKVMKTYYMGENGKHVKLLMQAVAPTKFMKPIEAIGFHMGDKQIMNGQIIDFVYNINKNTWNNTEKFQMNILDIHLL